MVQKPCEGKEEQLPRERKSRQMSLVSCASRFLWLTNAQPDDMKRSLILDTKWENSGED